MMRLEFPASAIQSCGKKPRTIHVFCHMEFFHCINTFRFFPPLGAVAGLMFIFPSLVSGAEKLGYNQHIRPILSDKCFQCHGPDPAKRGGDLRLDVREEAVAAGAIVPGDVKASEVILRIHEKDPENVMPPPDSPRQLSSEERGLLARWIEEGAEYQPHWAFTPLPTSVPVPETKSKDWADSEIDRFVAARLEKESLAPSPAAVDSRWLRRVTFDLTGLPPGQAELDAFLADDSPGRRATVVDRLLASPHYGEKMAIGWLDVARYADSFGYQSDIDTHAWPYRDWVIGALNKNLPWDQFITWQIAGDLLPNANREQILATAFNRIHRKTQEGGSVEAEYRQDGISDRVHTFGTAFMALTFECTRCHDHKYDPLTMRDYYSLGAFFNSIDEWGLLHGISNIQPSPTLMLTTPEQDAEITRKKQLIASAESRLAELSSERQPAFVAWLANPVVSDADLSGSYALDQEDAGKFHNQANPAQPAKSDANNSPVDGVRGKGLSFSGDHSLQLGKHDVSNGEDPVTLAFWLKPGEPAARQVVFHDSAGYDPGYNGFELLLEDGRLRWMVAREWPGNCIAIRSSAVLAPGEWTHVVVSYDGSSRAAGLKIHLNGEEASVEMVRDNLTKNSGSGEGFKFGERIRDSGLRGGAVDEIHLFTRAISLLEIRALHQSKPLAELIAATPRDEAGMAQLHDFYFSAVDAESRAAHVSLRKLRADLRVTLDGVREIPVMREMQEARPARILARGEYTHPEGEPLPRETPAVLPPMSADLSRDRLGLARWLTAPDHPLTARVHVNRIWSHFFGRGLVATAENFGTQGEAPSHPELLDWLARDFVSYGWDMKRLCRQIVLSKTYGQDSKVPPELRSKDPANILLARGPLKRLAAEDLRDQALSVSGLLHDPIGGPPAKPYLPESAQWKVLNNFLPDYKRDDAPGIYRRSLYTFWRRTAPPPGMLVFDAPGRDVCTVERQQTNTPLQPLVLLNDPQFVEAARGLAIRMLRHSDDPAQQQVWLFREMLGRNPEDRERVLLQEIHADQLGVFRDQPEKANAFLKVGELTAPSDLPAVELAAATVLASSLINLDEAITLR
jgi:mono/diheme cytochrome c family protein